MRPISLSLALAVLLAQSFALAPSASAMGGDSATPDISAPQNFVEQAEAAAINWRQSLVILIGNPNNDFATNLPYAERDLEAMRLYALEGLKVSPQNLHVFKNADSNAFDSIFGPGGLIDRELRGRNLFVFISGHGVTLPGEPSSHFLPSNADPSRVKQLYSVDDVKAALTRARQQQLGSGLDRRVFAMFDTCFSGQDRHRPGEQAYSGKAPPLVPTIKVPSDGPGFTLLSASNGIAYDDEKARLGALTSGFLRAAAGLADDSRYDGNANDSLEAVELKAYLDENVAALAGRAQSADLIGVQDLSLPVFAVPDFQDLQQSQRAASLFEQAQRAVGRLPNALDFNDLEALQSARLSRDQILLPLRRYDRFCQSQDCDASLAQRRDGLNQRLQTNLLEFEDQAIWLQETANSISGRCQPYLQACQRFRAIQPGYACIYQLQAQNECALLKPAAPRPSDADLLLAARRSNSKEDWQACIDGCQLEANQSLARAALARIIAEEKAAEQAANQQVTKAEEPAQPLVQQKVTKRPAEPASADDEAEERDKRLWARAEQRNSISGYLAYERICRLCRFKADSQARRRALEADNADRQAELLDLQIWAQVSKEPSAESLQLYLSSCQPLCAHADEARSALEALAAQLSYADLGQRLSDLNLRRLSNSDARRLQQALNDRGCDAGSVDGQIGSKTRSALETLIETAKAKIGSIDVDPNSQVLSQLEAATALACARTTGSLFRDCPACPEMVVLPSGRFDMGSREGDQDELPVHSVTIPRPFAMARYEVSLDEYRQFMDATGHTPAEGCWTFEDNGYEERANRSWRDPNFTQRGNQPAVCLGWGDAQAYVDWLNGQVAGASYRLPSEAEWEYAARAGSQTAYAWGTDSNHSQQCRYANGTDAKTWNNGQTSWTVKADCDDGHALRPAAVGSFRPNAFGLYDMSGNAAEWVADCYRDSYAGRDSSATPYQERDCVRYILRGGGWYSQPGELRSADRLWASSGFRGNDVGFRVARSLP